MYFIVCWSFFWVVKEGLIRWKKILYFLISNWHIAKTFTFGNIFKNSHSISDLLINGIFHSHSLNQGYVFFKPFNVFSKTSVSDVFQHLIFLLSIPAAGGLGVQCTWEQPSAQHIWNITNSSCRFAYRWKYTVAFMSRSAMNLLF